MTESSETESSETESGETESGETETETNAQTHDFEADVSQVLRLVINSLYGNKEVFLRELVSNASDALDKLRFRALTTPELIEGEAPLRVRIETDAAAGTLTISDNGVGMTREELTQNLGTVAHSGTQEFLQKLSESKDEGSADVALIGQFGVGFYSAYLVADQVTVLSRAAGETNAHRWVSDGQKSFTIETAARAEQGTDIVLHLKAGQHEYLTEHRVRGLVKRYSDYVGHPVELRVERTTGEGDEQKTETAYEQINEASALWQKSPSDVTDEQYTEFYKHFTHDWEPPLAKRHFRLEGTHEFAGILFVPTKPPFDLYTPEGKHGLRLYVKRVFIMDDCNDLLPPWLRFIRGVLDSEDLPLNVSREMLQDSGIVRTIKKQIVKKSLDMFEELSRGDRYGEFWKAYGAVIKEGLHMGSGQQDRVAKLARYESSKGEGLVSLAEYVERMQEGQTSIYYVLGATREIVEHSPHLEALAKKGYEVLFMTDAVDQWAVEGLKEFDDKPLVSAMDADLDLDGGEDESDEAKESADDLDGLLARFRTVLQEQVSEVRVSKRLTDSAVCLVMPKGGMPPYIERLMRLQDDTLPTTKRILELNPDHALTANLRRIHEADADSAELAEWIELLHDQALLAEGSPIERPARFAKRLADLMVKAIGADSAES